MFNLEEILITITLKGVGESTHNVPQHCELEKTSCDNWATCNNQYCYKHGCLNALNNKGAAS